MRKFAEYLQAHPKVLALVLAVTAALLLAFYALGFETIAKVAETVRIIFALAFISIALVIAGLPWSA